MVLNSACARNITPTTAFNEIIRSDTSRSTCRNLGYLQEEDRCHKNIFDKITAFQLSNFDTMLLNKGL